MTQVNSFLWDGSTYIILIKTYYMMKRVVSKNDASLYSLVRMKKWSLRIFMNTSSSVDPLKKGEPCSNSSNINPNAHVSTDLS